MLSNHLQLYYYACFTLHSLMENKSKKLKHYYEPTSNEHLLLKQKPMA